LPSIKEKLRALDGLSNPKTGETFKEKKPLPQYITEIEGELQYNPHGYVIIREKNFPLDYVHGACLENFTKISGREFSLIAKNRDYAQILPDQILFFDTETTGLAGGTGTFIFLIGFGYLKGKAIHIKQYFIDEYKNEHALLIETSKLLKRFQVLGSFNGKSYDLPLLRTRFILNRIPFEFENYFHLDLLHPSRRLWKKKLGKCDLQNIEHNILGFRRSDDIPGAEIPARYFSFLQNRDFAPIKPILQHNAMDILTLFSIAIYLSYGFQFKMDINIDEYDIFGLLKTFEDMGLYRDSIIMSGQSAKRLPGEQSFEILMRSARNHKKLGELDKAEKIWVHIIENSSRFYAEPYIELAKLYEHKKKKVTDALQIIGRLEKRLHIIRELGGEGSVPAQLVRDDLQHRKNRLLKKLAKEINFEENKHDDRKTVSA